MTASERLDQQVWVELGNPNNRHEKKRSVHHGKTIPMPSGKTIPV
jgi:hypothetical protein